MPTIRYFRSGFTVIELLIIMVVISIVATAMLNSGVSSQKKVVFQATAQNMIERIQSQRVAAQTESDDDVKAYGIEFDFGEAKARIRFFQDLDGDYTWSEGDIELDLWNLNDQNNFSIQARYYPLEPNSNEFSPTPQTSEKITVNFLTKEIGKCIIQEANGDNDIIAAEFIASDLDSGGFEDLINSSTKQLFTINSSSCLTDLSQNSLFQI